MLTDRKIIIHNKNDNDGDNYNDCKDFDNPNM